jgi:sodium/bile acid cotransporter 7
MSDEQKLEKIQALYTKYQRKFPEVRSISPQELQEIQHDDREAVIVDVRKPEEQAVSMIPGAITAGEFEARSEELQGNLVITYCTLGYRSGLYAQQLQRQGWEVANLAGSLLAWTHAKQELVDTDGPTSRVHVYGKDWNFAADGYDPVW